jgi:hypothetical protein
LQAGAGLVAADARVLPAEAATALVLCEDTVADAAVSLTARGDVIDFDCLLGVHVVDPEDTARTMVYFYYDVPCIYSAVKWVHSRVYESMAESLEIFSSALKNALLGGRGD